MEEKIPEKRRKIWIFLILLALVLVLGVFWFLQGPQYGEISYPEAKNASLLEGKQTGLMRYDGKNATFLYPDNFHETSREKIIPQKPILESFFASQSDSLAGESLALLVTENQSGNLADISGYLFRERSPEAYQKEKIERNGLNITLFTKNTVPYEVGAFFREKGKAASLVLSSSLGLAGTREKLLKMIDTFEWKKGDQK